MGLIDELAAIPSTQLGNTDKQFIDADTLKDDDGNTYRIDGIQAPETEKVTTPNGEVNYKQGEAGGSQATETLSRTANDLGYTNMVTKKNPDGSIKKGYYGRPIVDLKDQSGRSFAEDALQAGALDVNKFTSQQQQITSEIGEMRRQQQALAGTSSNTAWDQARQQIDQAKWEEGEKRLGFRQTALNEAQLAEAKANGMGHLFAGNSVQVRHADRNLDNVARNPWSDSFDAGVTGVVESAYGLANLLGESTGNEWLTEIGDEGVARAQAKMSEQAFRVTDYKQVEDFGSFVDFVANNALTSLPYMGATVAGGAITALATPIAGGLAAGAVGTMLPAGIYAGQAWNEQEGDNKNAGIAVAAGVAQATLDKLGLNLIFPKGTPATEILKKAKKELSKTLGEEAAEKAVVENSKRVASDFLKSAAGQALKQQKAKRFVLGMGTGMAGEAVTEAGQEAIAYTAAHHANNFEDFNWEDLKSRMTSAAVAGGTLGAAFSAPGSLKEQIQWADVGAKLGNAEVTDSSIANQRAEEIKSRLGYVPSNQENLLEFRGKALNRKGPTLDQLSDQNAYFEKEKGWKDKVSETILRAPELFGGSMKYITTQDLQTRSPTVGKIADMFGGNLQRTYSGANYESTKHHISAELRNTVTSQREFDFQLTGTRSPNVKQRQKASADMYKVWENATTKDGTFDPSLIPEGPKKQFYVNFINKANTMADMAYDKQKDYNPELGYQKNYFKNFRTLSDTSVRGNKSKFQGLLETEYKLDASTAKALTDQIVDTGETNIDEAFSVIKGGLNPGSHKNRSLKLSENPKFQEFLEQDIYKNMGDSAKATARYVTHQQFVGKDGSVLAAMLDQVQKELGGGESARREVAKLAKQMKTYLDAESGNLGRPTSAIGKTAQKVQKNITFFTAIAGLPLSAISSLPELALTTKGLSKEQIEGKGGLKSLGKELINTLKNGMGQITTAADRVEKDFEQTFGQQEIDRLGYNDWETSAATTIGATELNPWQQKTIEKFFKWNGLQGYTNMTRAMRATFAKDFFDEKLEIISKNRKLGNPKLKDTQIAEEQMRNFGFDVDSMVEIYDQGGNMTPEQEAFLETQMREGTFNFINDAVALPGAANRPLLYQDPRFALFTQFQGFVATFTATHIPKLWGEYVKRGTPEMKYSAFATMTTMIMLGFASQAAKDFIKYGVEDEEDYETGQNPHLNTAQYLRRGATASGLFGSYERLFSAAFPLYESKSGGASDWLFNTAVGEAPSISNLKRIAGGTADILEGEGKRGTNQIAKSIPGIGPINPATNLVSNLLSGNGWKFKKE